MEPAQRIACVTLDVAPPVTPGRPVARFGEMLRRHSRAIRRLQWAVIVFYLALLVIPAFMPLPDNGARIIDNLRLFAQFLFWGIWWPFVLLSIVLLGRLWCGLLCPEGALSEWASEHGRGGGVPRWMRWGGWPTLGFLLTTLYGQLISVYDYPQAALLILGGSSIAAMLVGYLYGRGKRVWCRYLCPVSGVFNLLARLSPLHYRVDPQAWRENRAPHRPVPNCAPLLDIRRMQGAADCHACGRCSGQRDAVWLSQRSMNHEILEVPDRANALWDIRLLLYGMIGLAIGAFQWTVSPWLVTVKQTLAAWLVHHDMTWVLEQTAPWWLLTNAPENNDVFNLLDGAVVSFYILASSLLIGASLHGLVAFASRIARLGSQGLVHLAQCLIPIAAAGLFLGLSSTTVKWLRFEGLGLDWIGAARAVLLLGAMGWSLWLGWQILGRGTSGRTRRQLAWCILLAAHLLIAGCWWLQFWGW